MGCKAIKTGLWPHCVPSASRSQFAVEVTAEGNGASEKSATTVEPFLFFKQMKTLAWSTRVSATMQSTEKRFLDAYKWSFRSIFWFCRLIGNGVEAWISEHGYQSPLVGIPCFSAWRHLAARMLRVLHAMSRSVR